VPLTKGCIAVIDEEDAGRVFQYLWCVAEANGQHYAVAWIDSKRVLLHRFVTGAEKGQVVDHISGNVFDNRKCNLRICGHSQNMWNQKIPRNNTSGYKGVRFVPKAMINPWRATISKKGKNFHIGCYASAEDAARAYDARSLELFGDYARLNFPPN
jgi:hypothetical protein